MNSLRAVESRPRRRTIACPRVNGQRGDRLDGSVADRLQFLGSFLRKPAVVGSLVPSSPGLARAMLEGCDLKSARTVVELGPGTGAFTGLILERIGPKTLFVAMELDRGSALALSQRFPRAEIHHDSAEHLPECLGRYGRGKADCIISGLPWANMLPQLQDRILNAVLGSLASNGVFVSFAYVHALWLPTSLRFRRNLKQHFATVETSRVIWRNVPPAFVYRCYREPGGLSPGIRARHPG